MNLPPTKAIKKRRMNPLPTKNKEHKDGSDKSDPYKSNKEEADKSDPYNNTILNLNNLNFSVCFKKNK